jgi:hypothetical protein
MEGNEKYQNESEDSEDMDESIREPIMDGRKVIFPLCILELCRLLSRPKF